MGEYGAPPSSTKKRKRVANDTPTSSQANVKKKKHTDSSNGSANADTYKTVTATTPAKRKMPTIQQNAEAGPSTQRKSTASDSVTPTRTSTRVPRPTMRKVVSHATKNRSKALHDYDSDSDSDRTPPPGIIRSPKKQNISTPKKVGLSQSQQSIPKPKVVIHLGAFEISSGSENDIRPPLPLRKKSKISVRPATPSDVINLCSDEDVPPKVPQKKSTQAPEDDIVVIQSSDEESGPVCAVATETTSILANPSQSTPSNVTRLCETESTEILEPAVGDTDFPRGEQPSSVSTIDSHAMDLTPDLATVEVVEPPVIILDVNALQASYSEAMLDPRHTRGNRPRRFTATSAFSTSMVSIRPRAIVFAETMPSPNLHTPVYFSRTLEFGRKKAKTKKVRLASIQNVVAKTPIDTVSAPPDSALTKISGPASCLPTKTVAPIAESSGSSDQEQQIQEILPGDCPAPISAIQEDIVMEDALDLSIQPCLDEPSVVPPSDSPSLGKVKSMAVPHEAINRSVTAIIEKAILDIPSTPSSLSATIDTHGLRSLLASQDNPPNKGHSPNESFPDPGGAHLRQSLEDCPEDGAPPRIGHVEIYSESSNPGNDQTAGTSSVEELTLVEPDEIVKSRNLLKLLRGIMQSKKSGGHTDTLRVPVEDKGVSPDDSTKAQLPQAVDPLPRENHDNSDRPSTSVADKEAPETETSNSGIAVDCVPLAIMDISSPVADEETTVSYPASPPYDPISPTAFDTPLPIQMDVDGLDLDATSSLSPAALKESFVEKEITTIGPTSSTTSEDSVLVLEDLDAVSPSSSTTLADVPIMATTTTTTTTTTITAMLLQIEGPLTEFGTTHANDDPISPTDTSASPAKAQEQPPNPTVPEVMPTHNDLLVSDIVQVNSTPHIIDPPTDTLKDFVSLESSSTKPLSPTQRKAVPIIQAASQRLPIDLSFLGQNAPVIDISSLMENLTYDDEDDIDLSDLELAYPE